VARSELEAALAAELAAFIGVLRQLEPTDAMRPVGDGRWTVADVAAHVHTLHRRAISDPRRSATPAETAALNDTCLGEFLDRELVTLCDLLERDGAVAHANLRRLPADLAFPFHAGTTTTVVPVSGVLLNEYLVHGYDIAGAAGMTNPISDDHARLGFLAILELLPTWGVPSEDGELTLRLDGRDVITLRFGADGFHADVDRAARAPVDIAAGDLLLSFPYGRTPPPEGCEALIGRLAPI
jgi:uncharacterized protein (TIGR03083 family)